MFPIPSPSFRRGRGGGVDPDQALGSFVCGCCGRRYRQQQSLSRHLRHECGKLPHLRCPHCPYLTKHMANLRRHVASRHGPGCA